MRTGASHDVVCRSIESAPGTGPQVRACSFELIRLAKTGSFSLALVGHVTKDRACG